MQMRVAAVKFWGRWPCLGLSAALGLTGCNADDADLIDSTHHSSVDPARPADAGSGLADAALQDLSREDQDLLDSNLLDRLTQPDVADAICAIAGVAAAASGADCEATTAVCRTTLMSGGFDAGSTLAVPSGAVPLADCPATVKQFDQCFAQVLDIVVDQAQQLSCDAPQDAGTPTLAPEDLFAAPSCLTLLLLCPELAEPLLSLIAL